MAFTGNFVCSTFKQELLGAIHDFTFSTGDTFKLALYTNSATLTAGTASYATAGSGELVGTGYTATGMNLVISSGSPNLTTTVAWTDFADPTWTGTTFTAVRGALLYNSTPASGTSPAVAVLDFGSDKSSVAGDFTVVMPTANSTNAIIRIA
jgi:hypothetical protein